MKFNKITAFIMASVMTAGAASAMAASAKEYYVKVMKGDIDGNGRITSADADLVLKHINGQKPLGNRFKTADVNWDGIVDIEDVCEINNKIHSGDVNDNGILDKDDAQKVLDHIKGKKALKGDALKRADINGDKKVDIEDVAEINKLRGKSAGYKAGNVLNDNYITSDDTDAILKHIKGKAALDDEEFVRADVNSDGKVDIEDYSLLFDYISK